MMRSSSSLGNALSSRQNSFTNCLSNGNSKINIIINDNNEKNDNEEDVQASPDLSIEERKRIFLFGFGRSRWRNNKQQCNDNDNTAAAEDTNDDLVDTDVSLSYHFDNEQDVVIFNNNDDDDDCRISNENDNDDEESASVVSSYSEIYDDVSTSFLKASLTSPCQEQQHSSSPPLSPPSQSADTAPPSPPHSPPTPPPSPPTSPTSSSHYRYRWTAWRHSNGEDKTSLLLSEASNHIQNEKNQKNNDEDGDNSKPTSKWIVWRHVKYNQKAIGNDYHDDKKKINETLPTSINDIVDNNKPATSPSSSYMPFTAFWKRSQKQTDEPTCENCKKNYKAEHTKSQIKTTITASTMNDDSSSDKEEEGEEAGDGCPSFRIHLTSRDENRFNNFGTQGEDVVQKQQDKHRSSRMVESKARSHFSLHLPRIGFRGVVVGSGSGAAVRGDQVASLPKKEQQKQDLPTSPNFLLQSSDEKQQQHPKAEEEDAMQMTETIIFESDSEDDDDQNNEYKKEIHDDNTNGIVSFNSIGVETKGTLFHESSSSLYEIDNDGGNDKDIVVNQNDNADDNMATQPSLLLPSTSTKQKS